MQIIWNIKTLEPGQILRKDCQFSQINSSLLISIFTRYATLSTLDLLVDLLFYVYALWIRKILVNLTLRKVFEASNPFLHCLYWKEQKINSINCQLVAYTHERRSPYKFIFFCVAQRKCAFTRSLASLFPGQEFLSCLRTPGSVVTVLRFLFSSLSFCLCINNAS